MLATGVLVAFQTYLILIVARLRPWRRRLLVGGATVLALAAMASLLNERHLSRLPFFAAVLLCVVALQLAIIFIERSQEMFVDLWAARRSWLPGRKS
jgi:hypothetical protein